MNDEGLGRAFLRGRIKYVSEIRDIDKFDDEVEKLVNDVERQIIIEVKEARADEREKIINLLINDILLNEQNNATYELTNFIDYLIVKIKALAQGDGK